MDHPIRMDVEEALVRYHTAIAPNPDIKMLLAKINLMAQILYRRLDLMPSYATIATLGVPNRDVDDYGNAC